MYKLVYWKVIEDPLESGMMACKEIEFKRTYPTFVKAIQARECLSHKWRSHIEVGVEEEEDRTPNIQVPLPLQRFPETSTPQPYHPDDDAALQMRLTSKEEDGYRAAYDSLWGDWYFYWPDEESLWKGPFPTIEAAYTEYCVLQEDDEACDSWFERYVTSHRD